VTRTLMFMFTEKASQYININDSGRKVWSRENESAKLLLSPI